MKHFNRMALVCIGIGVSVGGCSPERRDGSSATTSSNIITAEGGGGGGGSGSTMSCGGLTCSCYAVNGQSSSWCDNGTFVCNGFESPQNCVGGGGTDDGGGNGGGGGSGSTMSCGGLTCSCFEVNGQSSSWCDNGFFVCNGSPAPQNCN